MINVGFIGCGRIADLHQLGYRDNPDARIYAVCDRDPDLAEARKKEWGAERAYTDYQDLLADGQLDAVEVLTPYDTHEPVVKDAAQAKKHIACQKPTSTNLASADRMLAAAKAAGILYKITEIYVSYPPLVLARKLIDEGAIGEVQGMRINYVYSGVGGWAVPGRTIAQQVRVAGMGLGLETFDHGHHEWATAWYLMGEVERVSAWIDSFNGVLDTPATIMWKCRGAKRYGVADFVAATNMHIPSKYYPNDEIYQIIGDKGIIMVNRGTGDIMDRPPVSLFDGHQWTHFEDVLTDWAEGFIGATRNFVAAVKGEAEPLLTGEEGREILRFALAVTRSAHLRREVYLDELDGGLRARLRCAMQRRRERRESVVGPQRRVRAGNDARHAPQAHELTMALAERFDAAAAGAWEVAIGLELTGEGGVAGNKYSMVIKDGKLDLEAGTLPEAPDLQLWVGAGTWAAILLGKRRIETAVFTGKIKYEGRVEKALPLRNAFGL